MLELRGVSVRYGDLLAVDDVSLDLPDGEVLAEAGADSIREGLEGQAQITAMHLRAAFGEGLCGAVAFSWTDEWWRGGHDVHDWAFGLVDRDRRPKPALAAVHEAFAGFRDLLVAMGGYMAERATDLDDVSQRVVAHLRGAAVVRGFHAGRVERRRREGFGAARRRVDEGPQLGQVGQRLFRERRFLAEQGYSYTILDAPAIAA